MRPTSVCRSVTRIVTAVTATTAVVLGMAATVSATPATAATIAPASCTMAAGSGLPTQDASGRTNGRIDVLDSLAQVLPAHHFAGASSATLCSARDAYASFQVEVSADQNVPLQNVAMSASTLVGPAARRSPAPPRARRPTSSSTARTT